MPLAPNGGTPVTKFDLTKVYEALGRIEELASLTPVKAMELMSSFNKAYLDLGKFTAAVSLERAKARIAMDRARSIAILDKAPELLAAKKIRESDATRQAIVETDVEYSAARDVFERLTALQDLMKHNLKVLEMGYTGAKKIINESNPALIDQRTQLNDLPESSPDLVGFRQYFEQGGSDGQ